VLSHILNLPAFVLAFVKLYLFDGDDGLIGKKIASSICRSEKWPSFQRSYWGILATSLWSRIVQPFYRFLLCRLGFVLSQVR
jgi:hypothetical protein